MRDTETATSYVYQGRLYPRGCMFCEGEVESPIDDYGDGDGAICLTCWNDPLWSLTDTPDDEYAPIGVGIPEADFFDSPKRWQTAQDLEPFDPLPPFPVVKLRWAGQVRTQSITSRPVEARVLRGGGFDDYEVTLYSPARRFWPKK